MKIKGMLKTIAVAIGLASAAPAVAGGDIYEILPCDAAGTTVDPYATIDNPLTSGETVYFKVRLAPRTNGGQAWYVDHIGYSSEVVDDALFPLRIGIYVSGQLRYATLVNYNEVKAESADKNDITDLIFSYKTKIGDFALPIVLAVRDNDGVIKPASEGKESGSYYLDPTSAGKWRLSNANLLQPVSDEVQLTYWSSPGPTYPGSALTSASLSHNRETDYSLSSCGFHVQTVDFDPTPENDAETDEFWRTVHQGSTMTVGPSPKIVATAALEDAVTVYVWSTNSDAVTVVGGEDVEMVVEYNAGVATKKTFKVGKVTIAGGRASADFSIRGETEGGVADLVLSPWKTFKYDNNNNRVVDYVTVPVKCIEPLPASIRIERDDATVYAPTFTDDAYLTSVTRLAIYATQAPLEDVSVTIDPVFQADPTKADWGEYVRFSTSDMVDTLPDATKPVVTLEKGKTEKKYIYVYALRSERNVTLGKQLQLKPVVDEAEMTAAGVKSVEGTGIYIDAMPPTIVSPTAETVLPVSAGETLTIPVVVNDTYADMNDTATGYTVNISFNGTEQKQNTTFVPDAGDGWLLVGKDDDTVRPQVTIPATLKGGQYTVTVKVTSPIRKQASAVTSFKVDVTPAKSSKAEILDDDNEYEEGEIVRYKVTLSDAPGQVVYAFLVNYEDSPDGTFGGSGAKAIIRQTDLETKVVKSTGIRINDSGTSATGSFTLQDGASMVNGGSTYTFGVVLCTSQVYDPANKVAGFPTTDEITITSYNKAPVFDADEAAFINGIALKNGETLKNEYPKGQMQKIALNIADVDFDLRHGFKYKYTISRGGKPVKTATVGHENTTVWEPNADETIEDGKSINSSFIEYNFPVAGLYEIKVQIQDKDLRSEGENKYASDILTVYVNIIDQPQVSLAGDDDRDTFFENETKQHVNVGLSLFPEEGEEMVVKVTVTPPEGDNAGVFKLDSAYKTVPAGYPALAENEYYAVFATAAPVQMLIEEMDGTKLASTKGFTLTAEVMNTSESIEPGVAWKDYYKPYTKKFYVENVTPIFTGVTVQEDTTNGWSVAGGLATSRPIKFGLRSDVDNDLKGITSFPGIKVTITGCESGELSPAVAGHTDAMSFYIKEGEPTSYTFTPNFGSVQGPQTITLTIGDKDDGEETWQYLYTITPSKFVKVVPNGPSATGNSAVSQKYAKAKGRGEGHIYGQNAIFAGSDNFIASWNCSKNASVSLFGWGYKIANPFDNGDLDNKNDFAIDANGKSGAAPGTYYRYPAADAEDDEKFDSFLYGWLIKETAGKDTNEKDDYTVSIAPESPANKAESATVKLPNEQTQDGAYAETWVEGVFAQEWKVTDNLGDINKDGVPDYFAVRDWAGGRLIQLVYEVDEDAEADLRDLAGSNPDEDYLPGCLTLNADGVTFAVNAGSSYAPIGLPFTTRREIRGFADGLNATDVTKSDADFDAIEQAAWAVFAEANGLDAANPDLTKWSPEPTGKSGRMDPTLADTDGDGLPDGWEYFFWYSAHVWYPAAAAPANPRPGQKYVYERFNVNNILEGDEIPAEEVEKRFNPCEPLPDNWLASNPDFDNDGLSDLEELVLGTNPTHWDTDGDHMCDGWEVMMSLDPLNGTKTGNADGDFMAYFTTYGTACVEQDGAVLVLPELRDGVDYELGVMIRDVTTKGFRFLPKPAVDAEGNPRLDAEGNPLILTYGTPADMPAEDSEQLGYGYKMVEEIEPVTVTVTIGTAVETELRYVLIHDQVRDAFGFDPRTGWYKDAFGYVASRWNPAVNKTLSPFDTTGVAVNTRPYNDYDEYLVMKYRQDYGIVYVKNERAPANTWELMRAKTTNPSIVEAPVAEENTANDDNDDDNDTDDDDEAKPDRTTVDIMNAVTDAFHAAGSNKTPILGHGADTDGDGVPDGWELYMYRSPNLKPDMSEDGLGPQLKADYDNDQLVYAQEYAGVDSCNAYKGCATIYANHPGIASGWYNKFFPTHPGSINVNDEFLKWAGNADGRDTDGDGVSDYDEGAAWATDFYNDGNVFETKLGFVYATVADDGMTCCFRGAGMNPCTVDTDQDGLPDGWEMQHAGVPVNAATLTPVMPRGVLADEFGEITIAPSTFIADGLTAPLAAGNGGTDADGNAVAAPAVIYIAGGMDATWPGDAMTDGAVKGKSYDELLQRDRDVDFDHDGLQNFQEYLVQSMRHFRYDDTTTPLMGRVLDETGAERKQTFLGYMPFDSASPLDPEQMRELGYFASPAHAWDRAVTSGNFMDPVYMAPATGVIDSFANCAGYVSTDPRMADTDGDSMDDFYEMFHGLNPILGMDPDDDPLMMTAWVGGKKGDIISAVYATAYYPNVTPLLTYNAYWNPWIMPDYDLDEGRAGGDPGTARFGSIQAPEAYDPILYPWIMGSPLADADGDGIRNVNEAVKANVVSPEPLHSDPTPLWFTDATTPASYVAQYYGAPERVASMAAQVWLTESSQPLAYLYNFEEGEGYDTDNDMVPDSREVTTTATRASDILRYDDPNRRQALWFNGTDGFAMTPDGQFRPSQAQDLFKQFTVECWINPEMTGADQTILDRSCAYAGNAINKDSYAIRANYRIGLDKDGRVYGMFDNDDAIESGKNNPISCQRVYGTQLPLNKWSHVALTYDGKALRIYVNGRLLKSEGTSLMPANGTLVAQQNIGSTNMLENVEYTFTPGFLYIGARPKADAFNALPAARPNMDAVGSDSFKEFFKGYVDEVRIWDGARTSEEIGQNYLRRLSFDAVKANRDAVYASSVSGGTRNDNDGMPMLPPELIYHYNFSTLPGALNANDVAKTPIGFTANVLGAAMNDYVSNDNIDTTGLYVDADMSIKGGADGAVAGDLLIGWWANCPAHSKVYDDYHVIPWIENTVGHLPRIDGGCVDSVLYNEQTGGSYMPAAVFGLQKYTFPNSAMPYASVVGDLDVDQRDFAARRGAELIGGPLADVYNRFQFSENAKFFASTDLVPMGGAYAKSCMAMWDGSASDNWEYTGSDEDADGLPDWWEEYARNNYCENVDPSEPLNWDTLVTYRGMQMTASQAYLIDIALGLQPDGTVNEDLASRADDDHNGIPDWWEKIFGVDGEGQFADSDNDGLSNYAEYLLSFVFDLGQIFDPGNAHSVNANDIDYFFPIGSLYAGEIFTDNDMMEDTWEAKYGNKYVNPFVWDANSDKDEDGWSAFAECRYANFVSEIVADKVSHMLGDAEMKDYPVPTLKLSLRYNQSQPLNGGADAQGGNNGGQNGNDTALNQEENSLAPIIVKTYTHKDGEQYDNVVPDAVFKVQPGESVDRSLYLGAYADRIVRGTLTPGYVDGGTFDMEFYPMPQNDHYTWSETDANGQIAYYGGTYEDYMYAYRTYGPDVVQLTAGAAEWVRFADQGAFTVTRDGESNKGYICFMGERAGEIDLVSGEFSFDMSMCERWILEGTNTMVNIASSVFRINYTSKIPVLQQKKLDLFLGTPNTGSVREGRNRIVAFYDIDGDGDYTPGEPLGFDDNVEVSWKQGAAEIELTDTTPVVTRLKLQSVGEADGEGEGSGVASDRFVLWGTEDGDHHDVIPGELSGGDYQRVRLVRTLVNGRPAPNRVVADTIIHLKQRPFLFEGDVLSENELDLDWSTFQRDVVNNAAFSAMDITNVTYRIVLGNGTIDMEQTNNLFVVATVRHFDPKGDRIRPTLVLPGVGGDSIVYGARPTFKWTMGKFNTYTAFKLQIMKSGSVVWDSGVRKAPARDSYNNYTFVPDVYLGDVLEPGVKYTWNVSMYNAKFRDDAPSTSAQTFVMNEGGAGYGSIDVCVKYFGPSLNAGTIRVEAFETPDFTGAPVARATVKDTTDVGTFGVEHEANAKLVGLPAGQYYVRAYLDLKGHGKTNAKDAWESWGYACPREGSAQMFNPSTIVIAADSVAGRVIDVYVEDVDTNGNNLPDAWEVATRGSVDNGAGNVTEVLTGGVVVNQALAGGLAEREDATSVPGGLAAQVMMTLASPSFQAMVFDVEVPEGGSLAATLADATEVVDGSVAITDAQFDQAAKTVTLTVEADVENAYKNTLGGALYTFDASSATVNCTVWRKATLAESGWTKVVVKPVTVGREAAKVVVDLSKADFGEGGFFKVTVEK